MKTANKTTHGYRKGIGGCPPLFYYTKRLIVKGFKKDFKRNFR